jgi:hypothetical protein
MSGYLKVRGAGFRNGTASALQWLMRQGQIEQVDPAALGNILLSERGTRPYVP